MMSKPLIDKVTIAHSFGDAAACYDSVAHFQRWVGHELIERIPQRNYQRVLDLGTGTGYFLDPLGDAFVIEDLWALDLSEGMVRHASNQYPGGAAFAVADADFLPFKDASFDLVFSSLALQWCFDLERLFSELERVLAPSGVLAFSTLFDGSLRELKYAWEGVDSAQHVNDFYLLEDYKAALEQRNFNSILLEEKEKVLSYPSALNLMKELKMLGAHNMTAQRSRGLTGRSRLRRICERYESFRRENGSLPASYQVGFCIQEMR